MRAARYHLCLRRTCGLLGRIARRDRDPSCARHRAIRPHNLPLDARKRDFKSKSHCVDTTTPPAQAVKNFSSEQDDSASGFAWVAREPQLICGAKGRASSLRSIDYHKFSCLRQHKFGGKIQPTKSVPRSSQAPLSCHSCSHSFRRRKPPLRLRLRALRAWQNFTPKALISPPGGSAIALNHGPGPAFAGSRWSAPRHHRGARLR